MALNFPENPDIGQEYSSGGRTWQWDGTAWNIVGTSTGGGGGGLAIAFDKIAVAGQNNVVAEQASDTLTFVAGTNMTITTDSAADSVTFTAGGNSFTTIVPDSGANVVADSAADVLTLTGGTNISTVGTAGTDTLTINMDAFSIDFLSDVDTTTNPPATGQVLKWDGGKWAPAVDVAEGGSGLDADTLDGQDGSYYLNYNNLNNKPTILQLDALSVGPEGTADGNGSISYNNTTGVFTYVPPDLSTYIQQGGVSFADITNKPTTISGYGITDAFSGAYADLTCKPTIPANTSYLVNDSGFITGIGGLSVDALSDVDTTTSAPSTNDVLQWNGTNWVPAVVSGGGGDANQNAFSNIAVSGQSTVEADSATDTLTLVAGTGISLTTNASNDSVTITSSGSSVAFTDLTDLPSGWTIDRIAYPAITSLETTNNGATAYTFDQYSGNNPTIYCISGTTIAFRLNVGGHPFEIQDGSGTAYSSGLVHVSTSGAVSTGASAQGKTSGTLYWRVPYGISGGYRYQCTVHSAMVGAITVKAFNAI